MAGPTMVPKGSSDEHSQSNLNPKGKQSSNRTRFQPHSLVESRTLQLVSWIVSVNNFLQRDLLKNQSPNLKCKKIRYS